MRSVRSVTQERFTAGDPHFVDADAREDVDQKAGFLERQDVLTRKPDVVLLWHAVLAPQVASVRDRDPQAPEWSAEGIEG